MGGLYTLFFISLGLLVFVELLNSWLLSRNANYQTLVDNIKRLNKRLEENENGGFNKSEKKKAKYEEDIKLANLELSSVKMKSTFLLGFVMMGAFYFINSSYYGVTVARLPFEPFGFIQGISHRGLEGNDYKDCSMAFFYLLASMALRTNIQKILGTAPPSTNKSYTPFAQ
eukprot:TRINITY_DN2675_c0_g1_i1.p1 TRINITY_DN2675_c0_g1~~TRINITY_DN2675_c0_g1_i1.p1  ORF type:complete len:171 (-),score=56.25 TRINITY_DN2675_c0_g1_i1:25-537(-)